MNEVSPAYVLHTTLSLVSPVQCVRNIATTLQLIVMMLLRPWAEEKTEETLRDLRVHLAFQRLKAGAYAKCNRDSYESEDDNIGRECLVKLLAMGHNFKSSLDGYHPQDDDGIFVIMDVA
ncbi:hypothetical protein Tco_0771370 [Tanacetum coccineum]|uniref:Uncharacterized protein n=1 Tax=Tanacetum coccineum TaxID=301880 RepID=A0ABQ4ZEV7_9ASTR